MRWWLGEAFSSVLLGALLAGPACSSKSTTKTHPCEAGERDPCIGPNDCSGIRVCDAQGQFGVCECGAAGAGGSGATAGTGGSGATAGAGGSGATAGAGGSGATAGAGGSGATAGTGGSGATAGTGGSGATAGAGGSGTGGAGGVPSGCVNVAAECGPANNESCCATIDVPGGTYFRGNDPNRPATISAFRLDKYEVTVARFRQFVSAVVSGWRPAAGAGKHTHVNSGNGLVDDGGSGYESGWQASFDQHLYASQTIWDSSLACNQGYQTWTSNLGNNETRPINCVNWFQANAYCIWDGGFLPSEAEWNYAASGGSEQRQYPWGATVPGADADLAVYGCYFAGSGTCTGISNVAPVGSVPAGNGRYGHSDLAGSVWEWTLDWRAGWTSTCNDCAHLSPTSSRVVRGGSFINDVAALANSYRNDVTPENTNSNLGVRCARAP